MNPTCHMKAPDEDAQLRSVALSNEPSILPARDRADEELGTAKDALEGTTAEHDALKSACANAPRSSRWRCA